jgi:hypothetical protein
MNHKIRLTMPSIEIQNSNIEIEVRQDNEKLGTVTLSKGSTDWRPKNAKAGKQGGTQLSWQRFAELMEQARKN